MLLLRWGPWLSPSEHPDAQHGTGSGPWEVLRGSEGTGEQGMFPNPTGAVAGKMHLFQSWQDKDKRTELLEECKRKKSA